MLLMIYGRKHSPYIAFIRVKKLGYRKLRADIPKAPFYRNDFRVIYVRTRRRYCVKEKETM